MPFRPAGGRNGKIEGSELPKSGKIAKYRARYCYPAAPEGYWKCGARRNGQKDNVDPGGNGQKRNMQHFVQCLLNLQKDNNTQ